MAQSNELADMYRLVDEGRRYRDETRLARDEAVKSRDQAITYVLLRKLETAEDIVSQYWQVLCERRETYRDALKTPVDPAKLMDAERGLATARINYDGAVKS
jgi:uncharacterized membrane protein YccC